ncbi:MAG: hypothetical protein PHQ27_05720 [Victivallales bacterium]|nr:hypothetical protein [Victivallales bacterium]
MVPLQSTTMIDGGKVHRPIPAQYGGNGAADTAAEQSGSAAIKFSPR